MQNQTVMLLTSALLEYDNVSNALKYPELIYEV